MWNKINYLTLDKTKSSIQTKGIPVDENINWNDIKKTPKLQFKTIDDPEIMDQIIAERNSHHLNQAQGTPLTIEPLLLLIRTDSFTSFSQELLNGKVDIDSLKMSPTMTKYLKNLKQKKKSLAQKQISPYLSINIIKGSKVERVHNNISIRTTLRPPP